MTVRYSVVQMGARRDYAVPALLHRAGLLELFFTDICADTGLGRYLSWGKGLPVVGSKLNRLANRRLPDGISAKTVTYTAPMLRHYRRTMRHLSPADHFRTHVTWANELGDSIARTGFGRSTHLYSMLGECPPAMISARARGLKTVSEIYIMLSTDSIVAEERKRFPDWEPEDLDYESFREELSSEDTLLRNTDIAVCPSEGVRADLVKNFHFPIERTAIIPYEVEDSWLNVSSALVPRRILFAGAAGLRKGIHYLARAASILRSQGHDYEFRIAGDVLPAIREHPGAAGLTFLGRVPRSEIAAEFASADVYALPSLGEGSAVSTYQALAVGIPVVTTLSAGSVVRDGVDGYIVPERDAESLAAAIARIVEDRARRAEFSANARKRAAEYTWARYSERLVDTLTGSLCVN
ncbi:MAG TPA: glycosyltransferase family 4 protein [Bryobacteraceae bacterium]|nr:glycosyltransferase family 4 protein [Bryobacteraceae bacterium]